MKVTNFVLVNMINTLNEYQDKKLPQKISYAIMRNMMTLTNDYEIYDKQLKKLFSDYDEHIIKDINGNPQLSNNGIPIVDEDTTQEFNEQITDLLNIEIEIELYQISDDVFLYDDSEKFDALSPNDILVLRSILCKENNS